MLDASVSHNELRVKVLFTLCQQLAVLTKRRQNVDARFIAPWLCTVSQ
jgi:hypothetical protein